MITGYVLIYSRCYIKEKSSFRSIEYRNMYITVLVSVLVTYNKIFQITYLLVIFN